MIENKKIKINSVLKRMPEIDLNFLMLLDVVGEISLSREYYYRRNGQTLELNDSISPHSYKLLKKIYESPKRKYYEGFKTIEYASVDEYFLEKEPGMLSYLYLHNLLDRFCWITKAFYGINQKQKMKQFDLVHLFKNYLTINPVPADMEKIRGFSSEQIIFHLKKGWFNEIVSCLPLNKQNYEIGTTFKEKGKRAGFGGNAAWNIVQRYYSAYEFSNVLSISRNPSINVKEHKAPTKQLNQNVISSNLPNLIYYPFNLLSTNKSPALANYPIHLKYKYSNYPRVKNLKILDLELELLNSFKKLGSKYPLSIIDMLYELRVWANYIGINSILKLEDGGYLNYMMNNLMTIVFFFGGIAELNAMAVLGKERVIKEILKFKNEYISRYENIYERNYLVPAHLRFRVYDSLGIIKLKKEERDVLSFKDPYEY